MSTRLTYAIAFAMLMALVLFRTLASGWTPPQHSLTDGPTTIGVSAYVADNLSYVAWAQQARQGSWLFRILYTTTEHAQVMFNPLFLAVGRLASWFSVSPILVLNILAALSLPVVVLCVARICKYLGLQSAGTFAAVFLSVGGAGASWIRTILEVTGLNKIAPVGPIGPDLEYYDVYPALAYFITPYHAIAFALIAVLLLVIVRAEDPERVLNGRGAAALIGTSFLLSAVRPHVTVVLLGAYWTACVISWVVDTSRAARYRRGAIALLITAGTLPPLLYSAWVTQQAVWADYAVTNPGKIYDWTVGYLFLWLAAGAGFMSLGTRELRTSRFSFLIVWGLAAAALLVLLNSFMYAKLTYGCTLALGILGGVAVDRYQNLLTSKASRAFAAATIMVIALGSPAWMMLRIARSQIVVVPGEIFRVIDAINSDASAADPIVLADCGTGVILPGLGGYRVFCGHWALTDNNRARIVLLSKMGFLGIGQTPPAFDNVTDDGVEQQAKQLHRLLSEGAFGYIVLEKGQRLYEELGSISSDCKLYEGNKYRVLRMCAPVTTAVAASLSVGAAPELASGTPQAQHAIDETRP